MTVREVASSPWIVINVTVVGAPAMSDEVIANARRPPGGSGVGHVHGPGECCGDCEGADGEGDGPDGGGDAPPDEAGEPTAAAWRGAHPDPVMTSATSSAPSSNLIRPIAFESSNGGRPESFRPSRTCSRRRSRSGFRC